MGSRILWQDVYPEVVAMVPEIHYIYDALGKAAKRIVRPDTQVTISHVSKYCALEIPCLNYFNDLQVLEGVIQAEKNGYDAAMVGCFYDSAVQEARGAVDIPVTGPAESAMLLAQLLGTKFAIVADYGGDIPVIEALLRSFAFEDRALKVWPIRSTESSIADNYFDILIDCLKTNRPDKYINAWEKVANGLIRDGADVIIPGCTYTGAAFALWGYCEVGTSGVPVVNPTLAALKLAELLADLQKDFGLKRTTSINSIYQKAPKDILRQTLETFGRPEGVR